MKMAYTSNEKVGRVRIRAIRMVQAGHSTRTVARYFGYGQSTIVKWYARRNEIWHKQELPTRSSRPHTSPRRTPRELEAMIIGVRQETKRCSEVVHKTLVHRGIVVSLSTVKRVLKRYGCLKTRSPWKKTRHYPIRPDIAQQGDLVQFDTIHFVDKDGNRTYIHTAIDVYSRFGFASWSKRSTTHATIQFLKKVREYFPFEIHNIQTDNGSEFGKFFTDAVTRTGMTHRHIHPRSPNENGHLERFNRTIQEEMPKQGWCIYYPEHVEQFLTYYNTARMHMGIDYKTPLQMLKVIPRC